MTENEARLILDVRISRFDHARDVNKALEIAKQALKEIQQYREIGTVEEVEQNARDLKRQIEHSERLAEVLKATQNLLEKRKRLLKEYCKIGTVEECREAVEKQRTKKIIIRDWNPTYCPTCGHELSTSLGDGYYKHPTFLERCHECGQAISWEMEEE